MFPDLKHERRTDLSEKVQHLHEEEKHDMIGDLTLPDDSMDISTFSVLPKEEESTVKY